MGQRKLLDAAVSGRVAQADKKGWTDFSKDIEKSIKALTVDAHKAERPKGRKMTNDDLSSFFGQIGKLPTGRSLRAEARQANVDKP